jgi:hypothetical protein
VHKNNIMSKTFEFTENYQLDEKGNNLSKIELLEDDVIIMTHIGDNQDNQIYNLHKPWVYPNRRYSVIDEEETFEEL